MVRMIEKVIEEIKPAIIVTVKDIYHAIVQNRDVAGESVINVVKKVTYQEIVLVAAVEITIEGTIIVVVDGKENLPHGITTELLGVHKIKELITHGTRPETTILPRVEKIHGIILVEVTLLGVIIIIMHITEVETILGLLQTKAEIIFKKIVNLPLRLTKLKVIAGKLHLKQKLVQQSGDPKQLKISDGEKVTITRRRHLTIMKIGEVVEMSQETVFLILKIGEVVVMIQDRHLTIMIIGELVAMDQKKVGLSQTTLILGNPILIINLGGEFIDLEGLCSLSSLYRCFLFE
ncbi:hypothetical protein C1645_249935 [Glomus cerebriforme]|uniref:Uncharacterized protein n=1 Tax=Glomus cerebriforme TaxID=658196 RepID=A0A397TRV6_9GLOM|nr:hypothetical protein C1645_249935 [Glomus cerebriforme]